jgi:hypothetical protein
LTDGGRSEENVGRENRNKKVPKLQVRTLVPRLKAIGCCAREKAASKSTSWGGGKTQSALPQHTFLLPSVSCRVLCSRVLILFLNFKLQNVAIKLVEIALEKHKFPM